MSSVSPVAVLSLGSFLTITLYFTFYRSDRGGSVSSVSPAAVKKTFPFIGEVFFSSPQIGEGANFFLSIEKKEEKKSRIRETLNLSTDADHRTDNFEFF